MRLLMPSSLLACSIRIPFPCCGLYFNASGNIMRNGVSAVCLQQHSLIRTVTVHLRITSESLQCTSEKMDSLETKINGEVRCGKLEVRSGSDL